MKHEEFFFEYDSYQLFGQCWFPRETKAVVLLVHGMGEHSSRYADFVIPELLAKSMAVFTYDNFGHGKSSGKRGHCPSYEALLNVLDMMLSKAMGKVANVPVFVYGHSMGGNLVVNYLLRYKTKITGALVTSPFLRLAFQPPVWKMTMGKLLQRIAPSVTLPSELDVQAISRVADQVEKYKTDPLIHDRISPNYSFPIIEAGIWAIEHAAKLETPTLMVHGSNDQITDYTATKEFTEKTSYARFILFDQGYHELHNDLEKEKLVSTLISWMEKRM